MRDVKKRESRCAFGGGSELGKGILCREMAMGERGWRGTRPRLGRDMNVHMGIERREPYIQSKNVAGRVRASIICILGEQDSSYYISKSIIMIQLGYAKAPYHGVGSALELQHDTLMPENTEF